MKALELSSDLLPALLQEIAALTTVEVAIAMARRWGGHRLYVPERMDADHVIAKTIGVKAAKLLAKRYGRDRLEVPAARSYLRQYDARRLRLQKKSIPAIAAELHIGESQVKELLRGFDSGDGVEIRDDAEICKCALCGHSTRRRSRRRRDDRQLDMGFPTLSDAHHLTE